LPDFSGQNIPKRGKYKKYATKLPSGQKCLCEIPNGYRIYKPFQIQGPKKYPNWEFWFKNIPSGNPDQICQLNVTDKKGLPTPTDKATIVSRVHAFAVCA
jgi:hypothetical protein